MKLIKPTVEWLPQEPTLEGAKKIIEIAGRTCYKSNPLYRWYSEDKTRWINENSEEWKFLNNPKNEYPIKGENISAKGFVDKIIKFGHGSVLEHGTIYLKLDRITQEKEIEVYEDNPFSKLTYVSGYVYITTNLRVIEENRLQADLEYICEPTEFHPKRSTFRIICSRIQSQSYQRHRIFSYSQESTRYCDYSKSKFDSEVSYILPDVKGISLHPGRYGRLLNDHFILFTDVNGYTYKIEYNNPEDIKTRTYLNSLLSNEKDYFALKNLGMPAEEARDVLSLKLKTEFFMTGFDEDWLGNFKELRTAKPAHHEIRKQVEEIVKIVENKK